MTTISTAYSASIFDVERFRRDFPILQREVYGRPLVYLDNGATTQKPLPVLQTIERFHNQINANIHRGVHRLSAESTEEYERARATVQSYINAKHSHEVIFTAGATASINLVANAFGDAFVHQGDEIIVSEMEHHSNLVPWQMLCQRKGAHLRVWRFNDQGELNLDQLATLMGKRTKLLAITHVSNTLGTVNPIAKAIQIAHEHGVAVMVDGAQGIKHGKVDVQHLDADFYAFSGHKIYGPTGIGVLYGKEQWLSQMPPWQGGGDMVATVTLERTTYNELPFKFEAGTSNYIGAAGLAAALDYYSAVGPDTATAHEEQLLRYATQQLQTIEGVRIIGNAEHKTAIVSFVQQGVHPYDTGMILDKMGVAVRTGNHCTQPTVDHFGLPGTVRASFAFYNTMAEVDRLVEAVQRAKQMTA